MDVSCERCGTEYELEDDSVPEGGCPVQCTTCHHTFTVSRPGVEVPTEVSDSSPPPSSADWLLETSDGKLHRFRNLTSLQKWIIERKVTRDDKISRTGHAWRRLGEIVELGPFFDVVDQADRGQAAAAASRELKQEAAEARQGSRPSGSRPSSRAAAASHGTPVRSTSPVPLPRGSSAQYRAPADAELDAVDEFSDDGRGDTAVVALRSRNRVMIGSIVLIAVGIGTGLIYFSPWVKNGSPPAPTVTAPVPVAAPTPAVDPAPPVVPAPPVAPAGTTVAALPDAARAPVPSVPAAPSGGTVVAAGGAPGAAPSGAVPTGGGAASYDRLVEQADQLLENGSTERAQQMYERALKANASGVEAQTGMGYVMLDKGRNAVAVGYFQKGLSIAPSFGPALFGLGEAARAAGNTAQALESYRRYVAVNPGGRYVLAAQRQIRLLEDAGGGAAPAAPVPPPPVAPSTPPADPPAAAPSAAPPSPSQVLEEPAKNP